MRFVVLLVALVLALLVPRLAAAQIVNVQARFADEPEEGLHGAAEASLDWRTGSQDYLAFRTGLTGTVRKGDHLVLGLAQGEYGLSEGERTLARTLEHLRYRQRLHDHLFIEAFLQHEYNAFRRLQLRGLLGAGPRVLLVREQLFTAAVGGSLMLEYEELGRDDLPDAGRVSVDARFNAYLMGQLKLMENLTFAQTLYLQPRADRFSDVRVLNETAITARANPRVGLTLSFLLFYDRAPPAGVPPLDSQLRTALAVTF